MVVCQSPFDHIIEASAAIRKAVFHLDRAAKAMPSEHVEKLEAIEGQGVIGRPLVEALEAFAMALPDKQTLCEPAMTEAGAQP